MSLIKDTWGQLVRNRLWPIALGLVAALVAVPMLLAKQPAPPVPAPAPTASTSASAAADRLALEPVVAKADGAGRRRHVLGDRKDPFRPAPVPKAKVTKVKSAITTATPGVVGTGGASTPGGTSGGGTPGGGTSVPVSTAPTGSPSTPATPAKPAKHYPADSLTVRFSSGQDGSKSVLAPGKPLPEGNDPATTPLLVYLGLDKTGKQAIFLLDASVKADGDGKCLSGGAAQCETLRLRAGDTEFLDVVDDTGTAGQQYELDVVAIHTTKTAKTAKAARARKARVSRIEKAWVAKVHTSLAGAARTGGSANVSAGVGALLGSL
jgi:hypothetical protein